MIESWSPDNPCRASVNTQAGSSMNMSMAGGYSTPILSSWWFQEQNFLNIGVQTHLASKRACTHLVSNRDDKKRIFMLRISEIKKYYWPTYRVTYRQRSCKT